MQAKKNLYYSTTVWLKVKGRKKGEKKVLNLREWIIVSVSQIRMRAQASLKNTVLLVVRFKILVHAASVSHLFPVGLWHEQRVIHSLLLVKKDVRRISVDLLWIHLLRNRFTMRSIYNEMLVHSEICENAYLAAAVIVTVPFIIGVFGIRDIMTSSKYP